VIHGNITVDMEKVNTARHKLAGLLAQATIFLIQHCANRLPTNDYYEELERIADERFESLPAI
jgi:hypothetical protein